VTAYDAEQWSDLFVATAGAAAALAGLVFVAVSINIESILKYRGLPERALETVFLLLGVVVVSIIALIPKLSTTALGILLLVEALAITITIAQLARASLPQRTAHRSWLVSAVLLRAVGTIPFIVGGISVVAEGGGGLYWTVGGVIGAIAGGVANAWVLLVEIRR
jgi:modulator of FtsH protease